jgi:hypothetical protein
MSVAACDVDLVCAQLDIFTYGMALGNLWFVLRRGFFYWFGHDSLHDRFLRNLGPVGRVGKEELGDYSCNLHREFTSYPHLECVAVPKPQANLPSFRTASRQRLLHRGLLQARVFKEIVLWLAQRREELFLEIERGGSGARRLR